MKTNVNGLDILSILLRFFDTFDIFLEPAIQLLANFILRPIDSVSICVC